MAHGAGTPPPPGRERWLWMISTLAGVVSLVLSYRAFWTYLPSSVTGWRRIIEAVYSSAQLLLLHVSDADLVAMSAENSPLFQAARFLAVIFMGTTRAALVFKFFGNELRRDGVSRIGGHTVICGLTPFGQQLAHEFSHLRDKLVVVADDSMDSAAVANAMETGAGVLQGNAADARLLRKVYIHRAANVFVTSEDDGANIRVAKCAIEVVRANSTRRSTGPHIHVHISDPELRATLRLHRAFRADGIARVSMFNVFDNSARLMLLDHPLDYTRITENDERVVQIVIIGFGLMGEAVLTRAAMLAHYANLKPLRALVIDHDASRKERFFRSRYRHFSQVCDATFIQADAEEPLTRGWIQDFCADSQKTISTVVIALDNIARGLCIGLALADHLGPEIPIRVRSSDDSGLATSLRGAESDGSLPKQITEFGSMQEACARKNWLDDELDTMAKGLHKDYVRRRRDLHQQLVDDRSLRPWEQLDDDLIDSNRQLADHVPVKLRAIGCYRVRCGSEDPGIPVKSFTPDQVMLLAKMEHQRWMAERFLAGWSPGPRDVDKRSSPYLVEWENIPPEIQENDRRVADILPGVLASVGWEIRR